jgi:hypothetical protein
MVLRLVLDVVRRKRTAIGLAVAQFYLVGKIFWEKWPAADPMAFLLAGEAFLIILVMPVLQSREIYQLPVSRRTLWLAHWWLATAGAVLVGQLAMSFAQWSAQSRWPGGEQLVLSTTFAFLYGGCAMALVATRVGRWAAKPMPLPRMAARPAARPPARPVNVTWLIFRVALRAAPVVLAILAAPAVPLVAPFFFARYLPHTVSAFAAPSAIVMLTMAAVSVWGYVHQPDLEARPSLRVARPHLAQPGRAPEGPERTVVTARTRFIDRLTGQRLPLWTMSRKYLITYSSVIALGIVWWWVTSFYKAVPALATALSRTDMLPFASRSAHVTEPITVGSLLVIAAMLDMGSVTNIRSLRILPVSTTQLSYIPLGLGLVSAAMLWIVFLALHGLVLRTLPVSFRPDLFTAFMALTALSHVLRITLPGQPPARAMMSLAPLGIIWLALGYSDSFRTDLVQPAMFVGGLLVLAASFALMRRAVTRSSRIYQPRAIAAPF